MPFLVLRKNYFFETVHGGDITVAIGIVQNTMITDGLIIVVIPPGIEEYLLIGDIVIATTCGVDILGVLLKSITAILKIIGVVVIGVMTMDGCVLSVVGMDAI
jgi:hypothetical protein